MTRMEPIVSLRTRGAFEIREDGRVFFSGFFKTVGGGFFFRRVSE